MEDLQDHSSPEVQGGNGKSLRSCLLPPGGPPAYSLKIGRTCGVVTATESFGIIGFIKPQ